ncbi:MFS transporter, OFA family, oxalate/formate antiporter [Lachnospiraceae bacterium YSD2013]|nr:MFS transporter, OFA family, oxalate/formate antiporter [Lachnospiraceae bacterium YSD2013]
MNNKWIRGAIPALLLHCSIGTVYCWSTFSTEIANYIGASKSACGWAFSLAIFFLGMSAAFLGDVVEKDIHKSSLIATICFSVGMVGTGAAILLKSLPLIFLFYGCIMGIGLGTGYLSPVKTLMLWFKDKKGLATGLAVAGFGAAKAIATPVMQFILDKFDNNPAPMFFIMGGVYFVMMFIGHLLLRKPSDWVEQHAKGGIKEFFSTLGANFKYAFSKKTFIGIWLMFYINITCGLALISQEKQIFNAVGFAGIAAVLGTVTAIANAGGRLGFSAWADKLKDRNSIYKLIFILSIAFTACVIFTRGIENGADVKILAIICVGLLIMVNAGYGGGFSNVPTLLSDHFGMEKISAVHGMCLSAWAFAGLTGNQMATFIVKHFGTPDEAVNPVGYQTVLYVTCALYVIALIISCVMVPKSGKAAAAKKEA